MDRIHTLNARGRLAEYVATCDEADVALLYAVAMAREPVEITDNVSESWTYLFPDNQRSRLAMSMRMWAAWETLKQEASSEDNRSR